MAGESPLRKRPRLSRDQARDALIDAGKRLLVDRGLDTGLGLVTLNDAVIESGVPRASAYRVYAVDDADPQVAFRADLLTAYLEEDPLEERREAAGLIAHDTLEALGTDDPVELAYALREIIRAGFHDNFLSLLQDPHWKVIGPSLAVTSLTDWAPEDLVDAHRDATNAGINYFIPLYETVGAACGFQLLEPFTWREFALMASGATATTTFYAKYHPELGSIMRPTGPGGQLQEWSQNGVVVEGLARTMFIPDPSAPVNADLSAWDHPRP